MALRAGLDDARHRFASGPGERQARGDPGIPQERARRAHEQDVEADEARRHAPDERHEAERSSEPGPPAAPGTVLHRHTRPLQDRQYSTAATAVDSLLSGQLSYILIVGILDAAILSWLALFWFRRAVRRLMRRPAGGPSPAATGPIESGLAPAPAGGPPAAPAFAIFEAGAAGRRDHGPRSAAPQRRRLLVVYGVAAGLHAAVITAFQLAHQPEVSWVSVIARWWVNTWPIVPALIALLVLDWRQSLRLGGAFVAVGTVSLALLVLVSRGLQGKLDFVPVTNTYWLLLLLGYTAAAPLVLVLITGWRRIRAVAPLVLSTTLLFGFAVVLFQALMLRLFDLVPVRQAVLGWSARTSAELTYYGVFMLLILPVGALAWWLLRGIAAAFQTKRFSDVQLMVDCWWVIVTAEEMAILSTELGVSAIPVGLAAFLAYRAAVAIGLRRPGAAPAAAGQRLLFLRVFGYRARTEALLDRVAQRWRFDGPVQLVAGIDLATRTVDRRRPPRLRGRATRRAVRGRTRSGPRARRGAGRRARPRRAVPGQRVLLPQRHVAADGPGAPRRERPRADGRAQLLRAEPGLPLRAGAARLAAPERRDRPRGRQGNGRRPALRHPGRRLAGCPSGEPGSGRRPARAGPGRAGRTPGGAPHPGMPPGDGHPDARAGGTRAGRGGSLSAAGGGATPPASRHPVSSRLFLSSRGALSGSRAGAGRRSPRRSAGRQRPRRT